MANSTMEKGKLDVHDSTKTMELVHVLPFPHTPHIIFYTIQLSL